MRVAAGCCKGHLACRRAAVACRRRGVGSRGKYIFAYRAVWKCCRIVSRASKGTLIRAVQVPPPSRWCTRHSFEGSLVCWAAADTLGYEEVGLPSMVHGPSGLLFPAGAHDASRVAGNPRKGGPSLPNLWGRRGRKYEGSQDELIAIRGGVIFLTRSTKDKCARRPDPTRCRTFLIANNHRGRECMFPMDVSVVCLQSWVKKRS